MLAVSNRKRDVTNLLLAYGSNIYHQDDSGWSAQDYATLSDDPILLRYIADYSKWEKGGESSADALRILSMLDHPGRAGDLGITLGAPATNIKNITTELRTHHRTDTPSSSNKVGFALVPCKGINPTACLKDRRKREEIRGERRDPDEELARDNTTLREEVATLRAKLSRLRLRREGDERRHLEDNGALKEKTNELRKELKRSEEALAQAVSQRDRQVATLKMEAALLATQMDHLNGDKERLESEADALRARLEVAARELKENQDSREGLERALQCEQHTQRDLEEARGHAKEMDGTLRWEKEHASQWATKGEAVQERLAQLQSDNLLLRQQLEDLQSQGFLKERAVAGAQETFRDLITHLRAEAEKQCADLREQIGRHEAEKANQEGALRQLQQELADTLKKQSMSEASLEVSVHCRNKLEEDKHQLQEEIERIQSRLENEQREVKKLKKLKELAELWLEQEMKRNEQLRKKLEAELARCAQLESANAELWTELSSVWRLQKSYDDLQKSYDDLQKSKLQLEEIAGLRHQVQRHAFDLDRAERYKRDAEDRAKQEVKQKLEEVNLFLQTQAASQEALEQVRAANHAALRHQLESELGKLQRSQQEVDLLKESAHSKLERANEMLAESNTRLLQERSRSGSLLAGGFGGGSLSAGPMRETISFGGLEFSRPLGLAGGLVNPTERPQASKRRVEAYVGKMQKQMEQAIKMELDKSRAEMSAASARILSGSSTLLNRNPNPVSRAYQEYLEEMRKNLGI
ncbi:hypothetical protein JRQ81_011049 [Phrynocephalus forsythii]|uniref:CCDC144C-like coiled-coil domain-containing protein n=1 Tax=Phrynocephalus forsythii TaxID=171643 RepID=A0A9Q0X7S3_9SAUR|nr:hypothetical protein JRQ81_011049 [Phrynocephalus forsythii]